MWRRHQSRALRLKPRTCTCISLHRIAIRCSDCRTPDRGSGARAGTRTRPCPTRCCTLASPQLPALERHFAATSSSVRCRTPWAAKSASTAIDRGWPRAGPRGRASPRAGSRVRSRWEAVGLALCLRSVTARAQLYTVGWQLCTVGPFTYSLVIHSYTLFRTIPRSANAKQAIKGACR